MSGSVNNDGTNVRYWTGTVDGTGSRTLAFSSSSAYVFSNDRASGGSVRCIMNSETLTQNYGDFETVSPEFKTFRLLSY